MPFEHAASVWNFDVGRQDFDLDCQRAQLRTMNGRFRAAVGDQAVMFHLYYTTLFMWPVVTFGREPFLAAAASDPMRFDEQFWEPWTRISRKHFEALAAMDEEVIFCHDDLCMTTGPVFAPAFYEKHIFPAMPGSWSRSCRPGKNWFSCPTATWIFFLSACWNCPLPASCAKVRQRPTRGCWPPGARPGGASSAAFPHS